MDSVSACVQDVEYEMEYAPPDSWSKDEEGNLYNDEGEQWATVGDDGTITSPEGEV